MSKWEELEKAASASKAVGMGFLVDPSAILELLAERDALKAENERLTSCLKKANDQAEDFERRWYLADMELDRIRAMEPVAVALRFGTEDRICLSTVFDTTEEAQEYANCTANGAHLVPLYTLDKP